MFTTTGAAERLLADERQKFLDEQWPQVLASIQRLGLKPEELLGPTANRPKER
jgi:GntR family transcriptional regulator